MQIELSERQQTTIATAATIVAACIILAAIGFVFWLLGAFVSRFSNVLLPLATAAIAALVFKPFFDWMRTKLRLPPVIAVIGVFLAIVLPIVAFSWFFGALIVDQCTELVRQIPGWWESVSDRVREQAPRVVEFFRRESVREGVSGAVEGSGNTLAKALQTLGIGAVSAGFGALSVLGSTLAWVVTPVYFAFFMLAPTADRSRLEKYLPFLKESTRNDVVYLVEQFIDILVAFFRGQLIIAFLQGMLFAIGFSVAGLKYGFVIGLVLGFLNIIPYLGNIVGLGTALPLAFFQTDGGWFRVAVVLVVFAAVQMIEGYLLTPKIMGDRTGLHPMVIIVAIFFWGTALSGILGMILAIPLTAFLVVFWRLAREKYVREWV